MHQAELGAFLLITFLKKEFGSLEIYAEFGWRVM